MVVVTKDISIHLTHPSSFYICYLILTSKIETVPQQNLSSKSHDLSFQTTDGREVTTTVSEAAPDKWVITQKNKKAGGPDVKVTRGAIQ